MPTMETLVLERADNGVVTLTLNRPERKNAINAAMWNELLAVFREVADAPTDRVLVITGAGGAFCSGADLSGGGDDTRHELAAACARSPTSRSRSTASPSRSSPRWAASPPAPGCNMALGCDLIVASDAGPLLGDLRPARAHHRLRRLVAAAPPRRDAQGQGAGALRRHHLRQGGRGASASSTASCPRASSTPSSTTGRRASPRARRSRWRMTKRLLNERASR